MNDRIDRISKFKIVAKMIKTYLESVHLHKKILVPMYSVLFYLILLSHAMTNDAKRLFGLNY